MAAAARPFTVPHFTRWASLLVYDDGERREPEPWQLDFARDVFSGFRENWLIVPEGNGKTTFVAELALYGAYYSERPWIPVGASSRDQARILYIQAKAFVERTPGLDARTDPAGRFKCFDGYRRIKAVRQGGEGIQVFAADAGTGDGVIPYPYAILDELHRHQDLALYRLWKGKLRKRGASCIAISTAGEPGSEFEETRERIRRDSTRRVRRGARLRASGHGVSLHEYMVQRPEDVSDMRRVKAANPLASITAAELQEEFDSPSTDLGDWKRLKCNIAARSTLAAVTDVEWDRARDPELDDLPEGGRVSVGVDVAWKHDTFAIVPLWDGDGFRLFGHCEVLVPPRDGTTLHPDEVKLAFERISRRNPIDSAVMDMERAEDIAAWLEDEMGVEVTDRGQGNAMQAEDYDNFMEELRNGRLRHVGCPLLRKHAMNAIARQLPGGRKRFDRPSPSRARSKQDVRVIDALTAAGMVVSHSVAEKEAPRTPLVAVRGR